MRHVVRILIAVLLVLAAVRATLHVQSWSRPQRMAAVPSLDGSLVVIVERHREGPVPYRTFSICSRDARGAMDEPIDGSIRVEHEYESGGLDMTNMSVYWRGATAVADFGGIRLERTYSDHEWRLESDEAPAATQPASADNK